MEKVFLFAFGLFGLVQLSQCVCPTLPSTIAASSSTGPAINGVCTSGTCYNDGTSDGCYAASATCTNAYTQCTTWVANGFCTSTYTFAQKQQYCAASCGLCGSTPPPITCRDNSTSCAAWNTNGFCASSYYTTTYKTNYCAATCGFCSG
ncbi:unnamed protein product, partial [Mesorhabditis belari]|uniref:ShKT domain-containing protein n=1 Tax=Mesorhabditis belari TaxID=2138241 RepID=A0AAF3F9X8_9BILA